MEAVRPTQKQRATLGAFGPRSTSIPLFDIIDPRSSEDIVFVCKPVVLRAIVQLTCRQS